MRLQPDRIYTQGDKAMFFQFLQEKAHRKDLENRIDTLEKCVSELTEQLAKMSLTTDKIGDGK